MWVVGKLVQTSGCGVLCSTTPHYTISNNIEVSYVYSHFNLKIHKGNKSPSRANGHSGDFASQVGSVGGAVLVNWNLNIYLLDR